MKILKVDEYDRNKYIAEYDNYILAVGGDGTLLTAISMYQHLNKPFFGVASGTINFLMNATDRIAPASNSVNHHFYLMDIAVEYISASGEKGVKVFSAFNDIVLGAFNGWIEFNCTHYDNQLGIFKGSGVIVSTAQGSTGINRNNHGTILPLSSSNWSITGMQTNRTINTVVTPTTLSIEVTSRNTVKLAVDGNHHSIDNVISITITRGKPVTVVINDLDEFKVKRQ